MARIGLRLSVWIATVAILLLFASHWLLLNLDTFKYHGLHAPIWLTAGLAVASIAGLHGLARRTGRARAAFAVLAAMALVMYGFSLRWTGNFISGATQEHWAGFLVADVDTGADDDYCYRMDGRTFELRGMRYRTRYTYWRGFWPTAFSEAELKQQFANRAEPRGDGWNCTPPIPVSRLAPGSVERGRRSR